MMKKIRIFLCRIGLHSWFRFERFYLDDITYYDPNDFYWVTRLKFCKNCKILYGFNPLSNMIGEWKRKETV